MGSRRFDCCGPFRRGDLNMAFEDFSGFWAKSLDDMNSRMIELEKTTAETKAFINGFNKLSWIFVSGLLTALAGIIAYNMWG